MSTSASTRHEPTYTTYPMLTFHPLHASPSQTRRPLLASRTAALAIMSSQPKKKTLVQLRADKEKQQEDYRRGCQLVQEVADANYGRINSHGKYTSTEVYFQGVVNAVLVKANRAHELLEQSPETEAYRRILLEKARLYAGLGQHTSVLATLQQADALYVAAERKGSVTVLSIPFGDRL